MANRIQTYKDLVREKERLELQLKTQKHVLAQDINELGDQLKEKFAPVQSALSFSGKLFTRDGSNFILNAGANALIDLVIKKVVLSRAGWLMRLIVPFFIKNYSSHFISENKGAFFKKLFSWIGKKNSNGHPKEAYKHDQ